MSEFFKKIKHDKKGNAQFVASQTGATMMNNIANASNEAYAGMDLLKSEGERMINVLKDKKHGNLFEIIERTKFNMDAASKGLSERAITTAEMGLPHNSADILIKDGGKVLREVQAKSSNKSSSALFEMSNEKYKGMQKLFNSDKVDKARELAEKRVESGTLKAPEYADTLENMTGELTHGEIHSGGTGYNEAMRAADDYNQYARNFEIEQFKKELGKSVKTTAIVSSVIVGGISIVKNSIAYSKDQVSKEEFVGNVVIDSSKSAIRGGATGGVSTGIRTVAQKSGNLALAKTNVATSIAVGLIDVGITVVGYVKGDIDSEEAMIQVGEKGFNTMSSVYAGMVAGVVFGPGGVLVGSLVGYMLATNIYQTCVDTFKHAQLCEDEAIRLISLYDESIRAMKDERRNFEIYINARLERNDKQFSKLMSSLDQGIDNSDLSTCITGMSELANYFGVKLKYSNFHEFDSFMKTDKTFTF
jgi:hypothetical protein